MKTFEQYLQEAKGESSTNDRIIAAVRRFFPNAKIEDENGVVSVDTDRHLLVIAMYEGGALDGQLEIDWTDTHGRKVKPKTIHTKGIDGLTAVLTKIAALD